jgi:hypothetical protein
MFPITDWIWAERQKLIEGWARLDNATCELAYMVAKFERLKAKAKPSPPISGARLKQIVARDRQCVELARKRKRNH